MGGKWFKFLIHSMRSHQSDKKTRCKCICIIKEIRWGGTVKGLIQPPSLTQPPLSYTWLKSLSEFASVCIDCLIHYNAWGIMFTCPSRRQTWQNFKRHWTQWALLIPSSTSTINGFLEQRQNNDLSYIHQLFKDNP